MTERARRRAAGGTRPALCHAGDTASRGVAGDGAGEALREGAAAGEADNFSARSGSKRVGERFEQQARRFLERQGLAFVAANLVVRGGELDLLMRERDGSLVFVEVRARRQARHGGALASIGLHKRRRLVQAARLVWARFGGHCACRFDVIAFEAGRLVWLRDAFRADDI
ncbi:YraN family protein [Burkholderia gladioli]|uniref:YraN family protein n=1 Tax=Burkholderia gladioli TaxID=28095 RepID=UPI0016404A28|nr:YraN family protein [Burkholderia gladioli]URV25083.1 YraN family protein [Burkholderia gladioli]